MDTRHDKDASAVTKNSNFNLPIKKTRNGAYKLIPGETIYTCFTSDFFLDEADEWRIDAWQMIRLRKDLNFLIITKRIDRFKVNLPDDWGEGWENVIIYSTCENQERADFRLPILTSLPIKHKGICCEPLVGAVDISKWLNAGIEEVVVGGESGNEARICNYDWVLNIRNQCAEKKVPFYFKQTGAKFLKAGKLYNVKRHYQHSQARKAGINLSF
jgi:protein gp37